METDDEKIRLKFKAYSMFYGHSHSRLYYFIYIRLLFNTPAFLIVYYTDYLTRTSTYMQEFIQSNDREQSNLLTLHVFRKQVML